MYYIVLCFTETQINDIYKKKMNMDLSLYVGNDDLRFVLNEKKIIY